MCVDAIILKDFQNCMCMSILLVFMCIYHIHAYYLQIPEEDVGAKGAVVTDGCE